MRNLGPGLTTISRFDYGYNAEGDILAWAQAAGATPDVITYDDARQLSTYTSNYGSLGLSAYGYDDAANRNTEATPAWTTSYTLNDVNEITSWTRVLAGGGAQTTALNWDPNGNLAAQVGLRTYEWDAEDRLTAIVEGTRRSEFSYDGLGRRARIVERDGATELSRFDYVWCGTRPCEERTSAGSVNRRFLSHGFQKTPTATKYFYARDHLGSIREVMNAAGIPITRYGYDPWGRQTKLLGTVEAPFGYADYWVQSNGGLNLTWYRAYSPDMARWLSRDPLGEAAGINLFAYVENSPLGLTDPLGLDHVQEPGFTKPITPGNVGDMGFFPLVPFDFVWNYVKMRRADTIDADKYFHCLAHCQASHRGALGRALGGALGEAREVLDRNVKGDPPSACAADRAANQLGLNADPSIPCEMACAGLVPKGLPGRYQ